jgi:DNA mismatch repair ATPase MutL
MRTLGDELISSEVVAVIELVKNAYDADATRVRVRFHEPLEPGGGGIDVVDDGHGMSLGDRANGLVGARDSVPPSGPPKRGA